MKAREVAKRLGLREFIQLGSLVDEKAGEVNKKFDVVKITREKGLEVVVLIDKKIATIKVM